MRINGPSTGGGGVTDFESGGAPTNGNQDKASGTTSSDAITFQAPTGGTGSSTPSVALSHITGAGASLSGSGLGPYTVSSLEDNDFVRVTCTHTDDGDGQVVEDVAVVKVAPTPAGSTGWTTIHEFDPSGGDVTDVTVTKGGGATIVYASDGTTEIAVVEHFDRVSSSSATCRVTTSDAALFLQGAGTNVETNATIVPPSSVSVPDWSDNSVVGRVDFILSGTTQSLGHALSLLGGPDSSSASADGTVGFQIVQGSGPTYPFRIKRNLSGQAFSGNYATVPTTEISDLSVSIIVRMGRHVEMYATEQSTYLADDPSSATYVGQMGDLARAINSDPDLFSAEHINVNLGVFTTNGNPSNISVAKARWRTGVGV